MDVAANLFQKAVIKQPMMPQNAMYQAVKISSSPDYATIPALLQAGLPAGLMLVLRRRFACLHGLHLAIRVCHGSSHGYLHLQRRSG